jgi:hypothetical protein
MSVPQYGMPLRPGIHGVRNVRLQRLPAREHVAGPQECRVALHPRIRVAMQCVDAPIGPVQLLAIEVHAIARQPGRRVQAISLVGPPAIDPQIDKRPMHRPVAGDLAVGRPMAIGGSAGRQRRGGAGIAHGTGEVFAFQYNMQHHFEVFVVELRHGPRGIGKSAGIPGEFAVVGVPAVGTKAGAEINHRVTGKFFLPEGARLRQNLLGRTQGPVRLLIAERPERWHFRVAGDLRILSQNRGRLVGGDEEDIER